MRHSPGSTRSSGACRRGAAALLALLSAGFPCLLSHRPARAGETACQDDAITAVVRTRLAADHVIGQFLIEVTTSECVVTLSGCVESRDQVRRAKELAKRLVRVRVKNDLKVCTIAPRRTKATRH